MTLFVTGISFKTAPVELREKLAVTPSRLAETAHQLQIQGNLAEVVLVSTCNRVEIYGLAQDDTDLAGLPAILAREGTADVRPYAFVHRGSAAARHLFSVASGLDSMVLGETEITGQIKNAYEVAQKAGLTGAVTNRLFQKALQVVKAIRTKTSIGRGATSVGSMAVQLAETIFGPNFNDRTVMIIGAGKMGEACIRHLAKKGLRSLIVANRTLETAEELAREVGGRAVNYMDDGLLAMREADIVISSTGCPETVLDREDVESVMRYRPNRKLFLIDIAVPRDIDAAVAGVSNVFLYNIDHLEALIQANVRLREQELGRCGEILEQHIAEFMAKIQPGGYRAPAKEEAGYHNSPRGDEKRAVAEKSTILAVGPEGLGGIGKGCQEPTRVCAHIRQISTPTPN